ncbi:hypothetical protein EBT25_13380, partial [bacterium]|nr:hypothetical protein [bacterium]
EGRGAGRSLGDITVGRADHRHDGITEVDRRGIAGGNAPCGLSEGGSPTRAALVLRKAEGGIRVCHE